MNFIKRNILSENEIEKINSILNQCEWRDGLGTAPGFTHKRKNNIECVPSEVSSSANEIIMSALDRDLLFFDYCVPDTSYTCIFSKTGPGGYYKPHHDNGVSGHYSTTVFLSNPKDYIGGELCLFLDGREKRFKPIAGTAITYNTGIMHRVNEVIEGERTVAVFWTKSKFDDPFYRELYQEIGRAISKLERRECHENFEDVINDPRFILEEVQNKITRRTLK
jgi:PKHD-type hydroxylase